MPPVALGREWSGGRLKEISGGLKTAHVESRKKVEGDFLGRPVVKHLPCNAQAAAAAKLLQSCPTLCAPGNLPNPWIEPSSPALAGGLFTIEPLGQYGYQRGISEVTTEQRWLSLWPTASVVNSFIPLCFLSWSILHLDSQDYVLKLPLDCKSRDNRAGAGSSACPIFLSFIFVGLN